MSDAAWDGRVKGARLKPFSRIKCHGKVVAWNPQPVMGEGPVAMGADDEGMIAESYLGKAPDQDIQRCLPNGGGCPGKEDLTEP